MSPYLKAIGVYESEPCSRTFAEDLALHLANGYVFNTPTVFMMGRPVNSKAPVALITEPSHVFSIAESDAWLVYLFAGDLAEAFNYCPYQLPYILFERKNELRGPYAFAELYERLAS